jgi:hypothetical protein
MATPKTFPSPEMGEHERQRYIWALQAPFVKPWYLSRWIPIFIRRYINGYERIDERTFDYYCKWAAWEDSARWGDDTIDNWEIIAVQCRLMAHACGDSRLWLIRKWATSPPVDEPEWD